MPELLTIAEFQEAIRAGRFVAGDAVLYRWGRQNPLALAIAHVQRRALRDLLAGGESGVPPSGGMGPAEAGTPDAGMAGAPGYCARLERGPGPGAPGLLEESIRAAARYTHAGIVVDAELSAEMTAPRARLVVWERRLRAGDGLLVVRPKSGTPGFLLWVASTYMISLTHNRELGRYPWIELLTYWFRSLPGALAAEHFAEYFEDHRRNVCSGAIWQAWQTAGCIDTGRTQRPEAWYPGRMAIDTQDLQRIAEIEIVADSCTYSSAPAGRGDAGASPALPDSPPASAASCKTRGPGRRVSPAVGDNPKGVGAMKRTLGMAAGCACVILAAVLLVCGLCGCRGGLFGGPGQESGLTREIKVYEVHFAPGANSIANIGNAGTQSPMYQSPETAAEKDGAGPYFTGGEMPASGGANAGTAQGKYVQQNVNDANKRSAETDASAAAQLMAGTTQSTGTQTPAQVQRQGTATPSATVTANPQHNPALQLNPNTALTGQGTAQQTNPTSTLAGAGSAPAAVTGGTGTAAGSSTESRAPGVGAESVTTVTANPDGTRTVTTASGKSLTGKVLGPFQQGTESIYVMILNDGTTVRLTAAGANSSALGQ